MTEQWILQDINQLMQHRNRVVMLDPTGTCGFIIPVLQQKQYALLQTDNSLTEHWQQIQEELFLRCEAETGFSDKPVIFYVTRPLDKLTFLFDYCFTHGCLDLSHPQEWLKSKIFSNTGLQVNLDNPMLLNAAKLSIGKDIAWWKKIVQNLEDVIDLEEELIPFLKAPDDYLNNLDQDIKRLFEEKIFELIDQHYAKKSPDTLAGEVVKKMLDGLLNNEIPDKLLQLYYKWADSAASKPSLDLYIQKYKLPESANPWSAHPDHCFENLDLLAIKNITENFRDKSYVSEKLQKLKKRIFSSKVKCYVPEWWLDVWTLFNTETSLIAYFKNFNDFISYYTGTFSKVDRAIRNLYETFLSSDNIIRPLQEHYDSLNYLVLQSWYSFFSEYASGQQGFLPALFSSAKPKTAVIVADGLRYEIADYVAGELQKIFNVDKKFMMADMPSETEHNMSALFVGNNEVIALAKDREQKLSQLSGKTISFMSLDQLNYGVEADFLVLSYKDIDDAGEKMQQAAIKLFSEFEADLVVKITLLLNMGYAEVILITDHGFVLTGLLDEADKVNPSVTGKKEVHERYIRTVEKQSIDDFLEFERAYGEFKYVCAAKNHRPFKSRGVYGYSHGGFTPQEIIIPNFKFTKKKPSTSSLEVFISNKNDLGEVAGELFAVKIEASKNVTDLFASQRKVQLKLYAGGNVFQSSNVISMEAGKSESIECSFNKNSMVQAVLLDAITQEQLDKIDVKKSNLRDLGGLI